LKTLTKLRVLHVSHTRVSDGGLAHLRPLTGLTTLEVRGTQISDAGLDSLKELKQLVSLDVRQTRLTAGGVKKLLAALPSCTIASDHGTFGPNQSPPSDKEKPFVLVRGDKPAGEFKTFAGVVSDIQNGDTIEVHGNGPFEIGKL